MTRPPRDVRLPPWSREQIRAARTAALAPLLQRRGLVLRDRGAGNFELQQYKGLLVKASYPPSPCRLRRDRLALAGSRPGRQRHAHSRRSRRRRRTTSRSSAVASAKAARSTTP